MSDALPTLDSPPVRCLPRYQPMVLCWLAFAAGILFDQWLNTHYWVYLLIAALALTGWWRSKSCGSFRWRQSPASGNQDLVKPSSKNRHETIGSTCLLIGLLAMGAYWHHGRWNWFGPHEIGTFATSVGAPCCLEAVAITEPRWLSPSQANDGLDYQTETVRTRVTLRVQQIRDGKNWQPASGKLDLIIHAPTLHFRSGDSVRVFGRLIGIGPPTNPGQFDFQAFYRAVQKRAAIHAYFPECVEVKQSAGWFNSKLLSTLRRRLNELAWTYIEADEAAFASAILLGNREQLDSERRQIFLETGTVHLLAISGLHVGILAGSFFLLFRLGWVGRQKCLWATIAFVIFYAWLVEFRPPVSRAAILIVWYCVGRLLGENNFSYNLLAIAGLAVLIINPLDLFSLGAQLSFLAVGSLNFGKEWVFWPLPTDPIQRLIANTRPVHVRTINWFGRNVRTAFLVSGLIWCVALPLVAFRFHLVAIIALVVNPLLLVPIAWGLYGGLGVLTLGCFFPMAARVCGKFCGWNLALIEWMIGVAHSLPLSHCWTMGPTRNALVLFYVGLFFSAVFPPTRLKLRWIIFLASGWLIFGWVVPDRIAEVRRRNQTNPLICTFIDVGHGTSVLLQLPDGKTMLYDAGSFGSSSYAYRNVSSVLWSERIRHLDAVIVSHADVDHFNALPELSRRFSIGEVFLSPQMVASSAPAVKTVMDQLAKAKIPVRIVYSELADEVPTMTARIELEPATENKIETDPKNGLTRNVVNSSRRIGTMRHVIHPTISILNPPKTGTGGSDNSDSIVLLLEHAGNRILLPGDLETLGLQRMLSRRPLDCGLVMAPHHGSINSDPTSFMLWSTPELVVISGGSHRIKDPVVKIFQQENRMVYRTDQHGAVRCRVDHDGISVQHWRLGGWHPE